MTDDGPVTDSWRFDPERLMPMGPDICLRGSRTFLEAVYRASLYLEEGQRPNFICGFVEDASRVPLTFRFSENPEFTAQRLRKLGVAFDPERTALVVQAGDPITLGGTCTRQVLDLMLPRYMSPPPLTVAVTGIAEIRSTQGICTQVFCRDRYVEPTHDHAILSLIHPSIAEALAKAVEPMADHHFNEMLKTQGFSEDYHRAPDAAPIVHQRCGRNLKALASEVRRFGTGGSILFVANADHDPQVIAEKCHRLREAPVGGPRDSWAGCVAQVFALQTTVPQRPLHKMSLEDPHQRRLIDTMKYAEDEIRQTACLAGADGALILDWRLTPLGLGAKLKSGDPKDLSNQVAAFLKEREKGNRHRSMAFAVNVLRGAVGLVVSADGDITLFGERAGEKIAMDLIL